MTNKNMVLCLYLVLGFMLYDLYFDIAWPFSPHNHYIVEVVMAILRVYLIFAVISLTSPGLSKLPCALYIPLKAPKSLETQLTPSPELPSQNLDLVKMLVSFLLSLFLIHFKVRLIQNFSLSNFFISVLALTTIIFTLTFMLCRKVLYLTSWRQMVKHRTTLNCLLELLLFPAVIILKLFLSLLDPVYKIVLHVTPQFNFSLVEYFWSLKSKFFLSSIMTICLFVSHSILLNLGITQNSSFDCELPYTVYLVTAAIVLIISALPFPFLVGSYVVTIIIFGETFDATSRSHLEMPLLFPILYLSFGLLLSYPCAKLLKLHHPGFLFSMFIRSKRFVTTIQVVDITGKFHIFTFAPYATIKDLRSQINAKFRITSNLYWLSCCGKPLLGGLPLDEISRTVFMHGRLTGGAQCCLKGCENEAGSRKFDSMVGQYELKCTPDDIIPESFKDLRVCDKHYSSLSARGHKPPKGKGSTKSRSDAQLGILKTTPCIVTCLQCNNKVCLSSDVPCNKHNISVFKHLFSVACNFLDERNENKTDLHNDLYTCIGPCDGTFPDYICMSCQPFFLKSIKIENEYNETKKMFQRKESCSTSMRTQPDIKSR